MMDAASTTEDRWEKAWTSAQLQLMWDRALSKGNPDCEGGTWLPPDMEDTSYTEFFTCGEIQSDGRVVLCTPCVGKVQKVAYAILKNQR